MYFYAEYSLAPRNLDSGTVETNIPDTETAYD
jgi:hypothetical protein